MRRDPTNRRPPPDWLDEFKPETEPARGSSAETTVQPGPEESIEPVDTIEDIDRIRVIDMPVDEDWLAYFKDDEPQAARRRLRGRLVEAPDTSTRMWPSGPPPAPPPLPPPTRMQRPPGTWDELQVLAEEARRKLPRRAGTVFALVAMAIAVLAIVAVILGVREAGNVSPLASVSAIEGQPPRAAVPSPAMTPPPASTAPALTPPAVSPPVPERALPPSPTPSLKTKPTPSPTQRTEPPPLKAAPGAAQVAAASSAANTALAPPPTPSPSPSPPPAASPSPKPLPSPTESARGLGAPAGAAGTALKEAPPDAATVAKSAILATLEGYRSAYSALDARAARQVWPSVNEAALTRAFSQLAAQSVSFSSCGVEIKGQFAQAYCVGEVAFVTKVGSRTPRVEVRNWTFDLRRVGETWHIDRVQTR